MTTVTWVDFQGRRIIGKRTTTPEEPKAAPQVEAVQESSSPIRPETHSKPVTTLTLIRGLIFSVSGGLVFVTSGSALVSLLGAPFGMFEWQTFWIWVTNSLGLSTISAATYNGEFGHPISNWIPFTLLLVSIVAYAAVLA